MRFFRVLDAVHLAFILHSTYHYTVTNFVNPFALLYCTWFVDPDGIPDTHLTRNSGVLLYV